MVNNRITYATTQLSFKDNKADSTTDILGWRPDATLASGISSTDTLITFNESISGSWPAAGQFKVKTGSNTTEYIRYATFLTPSSVGGVTRGTGGSTAATHNQDDVAQLIGWEVALGTQSVSMSVTFNTEDIFHLGQVDPYENVEGRPDVELTATRVLDGTKPFWHVSTDPDFSTLKGRTANYKADVALSVYPDTQDSATGTADSTVVCSGMVVSSWGVSLPADGNFTESITLVGNDRSWGEEEGVPSGFFPTAASYNAAVVGSGVQQTEDFDTTNSTTPADISNTDHIQTIDVSVDITREEILQLGQKTPFFRAVSFPITVTTTYEVITDKGDLVNAIGDGRTNLTDRQIIIKTNGGLKVDLGSQNKLSSVTLEGFDAGGGNGTVTFEYTNSNALTITHDAFIGAFRTNTDLL